MFVSTFTLQKETPYAGVHGSLKASQLQGLFLETFRVAGNLLLFHPQPFCGSAKHLQPRGSEWQVK